MSPATIMDIVERYKKDWDEKKERQEFEVLMGKLTRGEWMSVAAFARVVELTIKYVGGEKICSEKLRKRRTKQK